MIIKSLILLVKRTIVGSQVVVGICLIIIQIRTSKQIRIIVRSFLAI